MKSRIIVCVVALVWIFPIFLNQASAQYVAYEYSTDTSNYGGYGDYENSGWSNVDWEDYYQRETDPADYYSYYEETTKTSQATEDYDSKSPFSTGDSTNNNIPCACDWSKVPGSVNRFPSYIRNIQNAMLSRYFGGRSQFRKSYPSFMNKYSQKGGSRGQLNWTSIRNNFPIRNNGGRGQTSLNQNNRPSNNGNRGTQSSSGNIKNNNNKGNTGKGTNNNKGNQISSRNTNNRGNININQGKQNSNSNNNGRGNSGSNSRPSGAQNDRNILQPNRGSSNNLKGNSGNGGGNIKQLNNGSKGSSGQNSNSFPNRGGSVKNNKQNANIKTPSKSGSQIQKCNCSGSFTSSRAMDRMRNYYPKGSLWKRG